MNNIDVIIIFLYVYDLLIIGNKSRGVEEVKVRLKLEFEMADMGKFAYFLGIEFKQVESEIFMHHRKYINDVLNKFNMLNYNIDETPAEVNLKLDKGEHEPAVDNTLYMQMVGCLGFIYHTRPEISYCVGLGSRFMNDPRRSHMVASKRILRYLRDTSDFGIIFSNQTAKGSLQLVAYSSLDWNGDLLERKSTMGYVFLLFGSPISWCSKKQEVLGILVLSLIYTSTYSIFTYIKLLLPTYSHLKSQHSSIKCRSLIYGHSP
ncbi:PREDICTED: uncharacterized protein LOC109326369 [Lupinus angustifolius]|uniref:uncharacterized protein LOC109326369 n=1 Tax=Lupinus angustifolius TaxID=3871 RepID=UPI00092F19E3|nr:PREDICTED: uncharacterized protein LOC109326369 [Lupinus angustifolius]